ncbi:hypothetical protein XIS1_1120042 [Xenorhabdus innexi]|uniref:Uncharacterized protein n=1 Tax=Xenorhabdus innexi TaxID=290109 RepID=A0A1N6MR63_9GAMM|nr:hypothetical protein XIS1_1120042 [Xenorhabdus innexi]
MLFSLQPIYRMMLRNYFFTEIIFYGIVMLYLWNSYGMPEKDQEYTHTFRSVFPIHD